MPGHIPARLAAGLLLSAAIGLLALRRGSLSRSGVLGAILTGTLLFGLGGFSAGFTLIVFFVSSSLLSKFTEARRRTLSEKYAKGSRRDFWQAMANAGVASAFAVGAALASWAGRGDLAGLLVCGMVGALATSNGDTWATEIGAFSRVPPRSILPPFARVEPGTSGGITALGTGAALAGAMLIGITFALLRAVGIDPEPWREAGSAFTVIAAAEVGGLAGAMFDSLLGATVQGLYRDEARGRITEKARDATGKPNPLARGLPWMTNDLVNFLASFIGALVAVLIRLAAP